MRWKFNKQFLLQRIIGLGLLAASVLVWILSDEGGVAVVLGLFGALFLFTRERFI